MLVCQRVTYVNILERQATIFNHSWDTFQKRLAGVNMRGGEIIFFVAGAVL